MFYSQFPFLRYAQLFSRIIPNKYAIVLTCSAAALFHIYFYSAFQLFTKFYKEIYNFLVSEKTRIFAESLQKFIEDELTSMEAENISATQYYVVTSYDPFCNPKVFFIKKEKKTKIIFKTIEKTNFK